MAAQMMHPLTLSGRDPQLLRGDPITGDRYYSKEFAQREWDHMWTKIWHIAGRLKDLQEPGDYVVHNFMRESVIVVKQDNGSLRAFYNTCGHRGQRLVSASSSTDNFHCPYHGWVYGKDGVCKDVPDPEDYPQGNPAARSSSRSCAVTPGADSSGIP